LDGTNGRRYIPLFPVKYINNKHYPQTGIPRGIQRIRFEINQPGYGLNEETIIVDLFDAGSRSRTPLKRFKVTKLQSGLLDVSYIQEGKLAWHGRGKEALFTIIKNWLNGSDAVPHLPARLPLQNRGSQEVGYQQYVSLAGRWIDIPVRVQADFIVPKLFEDTDGTRSIGLLIQGHESEPPLRRVMANTAGTDFKVVRDKAALSNPTHETRGGIDLSQQDAALHVQKDPKGGIKVDVDPALIARIEREGMTEVIPVIINMRPVDMQSLSGMDTHIQTPGYYH